MRLAVAAAARRQGKKGNPVARLRNPEARTEAATAEMEQMPSIFLRLRLSVTDAAVLAELAAEAAAVPAQRELASAAHEAQPGKAARAAKVLTAEPDAF